ncbi:MAG TPA: UDP-N-acetylmuramate dehydrogenase [Thermoanaerobaculia bacterium]|nr:UDP-N-acetylmuramate dehydrogenase [Thermoanaerobaculia bacterium]
MPSAALQERVPLAPFTTIGIGGPARFFLRATTVDEIRAGLDWARERDRRVFILGGGSNLLISDDGFDGLVLYADLHGVTVESEDEFAMVKVAAGEPWDAFVARAVENDWAGIECLSGIPGSTGATPIQNVGAYGQEVSETIARVEALDRTTGLVTWFTNWDCRFAYRSSLFKSYERDRYVVLSVTFRLARGGEAAVKYPELVRYVEERGIDRRDLRGVRDSVIAIRKRKGMVLDPTDPDTRSDGSFFMNPILTAEHYATFAERAPDAPHFPSGDGVKLSAAWLIEQAGFPKGYVHGNVGLSTKHTLAIINRGGGTAREVAELVGMIQERVRAQFGVEIHPEPNFIGFSPLSPPAGRGPG